MSNTLEAVLLAMSTMLFLLLIASFAIRGASINQQKSVTPSLSITDMRLQIKGYQPLALYFAYYATNSFRSANAKVIFPQYTDLEIVFVDCFHHFTAKLVSPKHGTILLTGPMVPKTRAGAGASSTIYSALLEMTATMSEHELGKRYVVDYEALASAAISNELKKDGGRMTHG